MIAHKLEKIKKGNNRYHCTVCLQTWTAEPRIQCPGIPVLYEKDPNFQTLTNLASERYYPLDPAKPDAAYRTRTSPYYGWLYDKRKCEQKPLTPGQVAGKSKRSATMKERYGCALCDKYYSKKDQVHFHGRICPHCWVKGSDYNEFVQWAKNMVKAHCLVIDLVTTPEDRPRYDTGVSPLRYLTKMREYFDRDAYTLNGYRVLDLETGNIVKGMDLNSLLVPPSRNLADPPTVLVPSRFSLDVAYRSLGFDTRAHSYGIDRKSPYELNPELFLFSYNRYHSCHLYRDRDWVSLIPFDTNGREIGLTEREYFEWLADLLGLQRNQIGNTAADLARHIVLYLAAQPEIDLNEEPRSKTDAK